MSNMDQDLSVFFTTATQAKDFSYRLSQVLSKLYETNFNLAKSLGDTIGINRRDALLILFRENNIHEDSLSEVKTALEGMQKYIASLPVLSLTVAFEPTDDTVKVLSEWFVVTMKKQVLFDISVDKKIIAGSVFHFNGKYKDFSIAPAFQQILESVINPSVSSSKAKTIQVQNQGTNP